MISPIFIPNQTKGQTPPTNGRGPIDNHPPRKRSTPNADIKIIWQYSARKNKAKDILEYSTLNPETNSDSPSIKSKGTLFVSAKADIKNIIAAGNKGTKNQTFF